MADSSWRRSRSRSPQRRPPKTNRGFRWKDHRSNDSGHDRHGSGRNERDHGSSRDFRDRDRSRERDRYDRRDDRRRSRSPPRRHEPVAKGSRADGVKLDRGDKKDQGDKKERKGPKAGAIGPGQEFIVVNVNDRLGTKTAIPCLPSDTIAQFKLMLAARIGREPGQIMLRRQGERPFKDPLTLEDYGISNGVQLDLEIDTGD